MTAGEFVGFGVGVAGGMLAGWTLAVMVQDWTNMGADLISRACELP